MDLYLCSILDEIRVPQTHATLLYEDNFGSLLTAHAGQPTKQSWHIDTSCHYALLTDRVELSNLVALEEIAFGFNAADAITKQIVGSLFTIHLDTITGSLAPPYVSSVPLDSSLKPAF